LVAHARARRIARFTDQLSLFVQQRCMESGVSLCLVDDYMDHLYAQMFTSNEECTLVQLLRVLTNHDAREHLFKAYGVYLHAPKS
jgi:hypothetical protein